MPQATASRPGFAEKVSDDWREEAQGVLKQRCFSCHGESGANEGGFNYALNRKRLVRELVVPGSADESKCFSASSKARCRLMGTSCRRANSTR